MSDHPLAGEHPPEPDGILGAARAFRLLAPLLLAVGISLALLMAAAQALYSLDPKRVEIANSGQNSVDYLVVQRQLERIAAAKPVSVALLGDSSCLMGVDPSAISAALGGRSAAAYCVIAYVGPAGYAPMMRRLISGPSRPETIVLMFHPVQYQRDPSWESWPPFVADWTPRRPPTQAFPIGGLDYIRLTLLGPWLFEPLPGAYGLFYGGEAQFLGTMDSSMGSAVDPALGLKEKSLAEVDEIVAKSSPQDGPDISYALNEAFRDALASLRDVIRDFGPDSVLLVVSPIPDYNFAANGDFERNEAGREIASLLGLPERNFVTTPPTLPVVYFSSQTHLTRWGKQHYSRLLGEALAERLSPH